MNRLEIPQILLLVVGGAFIIAYMIWDRRAKNKRGSLIKALAEQNYGAYRPDSKDFWNHLNTNLLRYKYKGKLSNLVAQDVAGYAVTIFDYAYKIPKSAVVKLNGIYIKINDTHCPDLLLTNKQMLDQLPLDQAWTAGRPRIPSEQIPPQFADNVSVFAKQEEQDKVIAYLHQTEGLAKLVLENDFRALAANQREVAVYHDKQYAADLAGLEKMVGRAQQIISILGT